MEAGGHKLRQEMPKEGLEEAAPEVVQEAAAGVCSASCSVDANNEDELKSPCPICVDNEDGAKVGWWKEGCVVHRMWTVVLRRVQLWRAFIRRETQACVEAGARQVAREAHPSGAVQPQGSSTTMAKVRRKTIPKH